MRMESSRIIGLVLLSAFVATGCATTRARRPDPSEATNQQIAQLQSDLQAKDQEIQELRAQLESYDRSIGSFSSSSKSGSSSNIRVPGVSVSDVQKALVRAGFDPGPVDGRLGKRTKSAIKEFQRRNNLKADGIVGERTWSYLKA